MAVDKQGYFIKGNHRSYFRAKLLWKRSSARAAILPSLEQAKMGIRGCVDVIAKYTVGGNNDLMLRMEDLIAAR